LRRDSFFNQTTTRAKDPSSLPPGGSTEPDRVLPCRRAADQNPHPGYPTAGRSARIPSGSALPPGGKAEPAPVPNDRRAAG